MSFVPVTGPATFHPADVPRDGVVEFSDERRTLSLPIRAALPVLTKTHHRDDVHPSVALLGHASLLGLRLVAAGRLEPADDHWRAFLDRDDTDRLERMAAARSYDGCDAERARVLIRGVLDAVADLMPRGNPGRGRPVRSPTAPKPFATEVADRLSRRVAERARLAAGDADLPQLVRLSLRIEADEEELVAGSVRVVPQVHDERDPLHFCDAGRLWTADDHGFGGRALTHATLALRAAADAWSPLDRLLELQVPDEISLDGEEIADLLESGVAALRDRGVDVLWPRALGRDLTATAVLDRQPSGPREEPLMTGLLTPDALFGFSWQVALHGDPLTQEEMDRLAGAAGPLLKLRGQWTVVDPSVARKARKRLLRTVTPVQAVAGALTGLAEVTSGVEEQVVVGASLMRMRELLETAATREPLEQPAGLAATMRDYQRHGLTWLDQLTALGLGACLADDMGLGKTLTLISLVLHRAETGRGGPVLVVCPASLLGNWEAEVHRFAPGTPVRRFHGSRRDLTGLGPGGDQAGDQGGDPGPSFVLTTYGTMRRDQEVLAEVAWDLVVADEAQHVKNPRSGTARAIRRIPARARIALTGTPVENNLSELWAILDFTTPGLLGSRNAFRKAWAAAIESGVDPDRARRFQALIEPFLLRRRKSDPGIAPELPDKVETDHRLSLTREQVVLYEAFVRETMERIERSDEDARRGLVLALLTGLKQICNHPAHFLKQHGLGQGASGLGGRSEKIDLLDDLLDTILSEGGAVLVFTQYVAMARLVEDHLARRGIPHQFLHGGTPVAEREAMVARFQRSEGGQGVPVFLLSLKAGGTGLNLTRADHVVHLDRWWNPAVEDQATDRAHRIGQTRTVQVHRMITTGTLEERIHLLLARKRVLADSVLARGEAALTELSDTELLDLVALRPERA